MPRSLGFVLGAALLIAGIYVAAVRGLADAHYTNARLTLTEGTSSNRGPRPEAVASAFASMREALALEPSNPHYVEQAARLQELRALGLQPRDPARLEGLRQSLAQYRHAAAMRPGSPSVWASSAMLKVRLNDADYEFYGALERAGRLGPWEPQVQIAMIDIGLATWNWLARPGKNWVLAALERGMLRQSVEIKRIAAARGSLQQVCAEVGVKASRTATLCVKK
jgi:hypothetical protein